MQNSIYMSEFEGKEVKTKGFWHGFSFFILFVRIMLFYFSCFFSDWKNDAYIFLCISECFILDVLHPIFCVFVCLLEQLFDRKLTL
jgi:hypothetical protein